MTTLPAELFALILSILIADQEANRETLDNLCLTCSTFYSQCQAARFQHLRLTRQKDSRSGSRSPGAELVELLSSSPHLALYIKEVTILEVQDAFWIPLDDQLLEGVNLLALDSITRLTIHRKELLGANRWVDCAPGVKKAIRTLCTAPALSHLSLEGLPVSLLHACAPSLKHLEMIDPDFCKSSASGGGRDLTDNATSIQRNSPSSDIILETLNLLNQFEKLHDIVKLLREDAPYIKVDQLRTLKFTDTDSPQDVMELTTSLLPLCCRSLETLAFELSIPDIAPVDLGMCPSLKTLELSINSWASAIFQAGVLVDHVLQVVARIPQNSQLKHLKIYSALGTFMGDLSEIPERLREIRQLVEALSEKGRFPSTMTDIDVRIILVGYDEAERAAFSGMMDEAFNDCPATPLVRLEITHIARWESPFSLTSHR